MRDAIQSFVLPGRVAQELMEATTLADMPLKVGHFLSLSVLRLDSPTAGQSRQRNGKKKPKVSQASAFREGWIESS